MHTYSTKTNTTGVTCREGTADSFGAHEFIPGFSGIRRARSLVFCVMLCKYNCLSFFFSPLYYLFFTRFGIFKLFFSQLKIMHL